MQLNQNIILVLRQAWSRAKVNIAAKIVFLIICIISIIVFVLMSNVKSITDMDRDIKKRQIQRVKDKTAIKALLDLRTKLAQTVLTPEIVAKQEQQATTFFERFKKIMLPPEKPNTAPLTDFRDAHIKTLPYSDVVTKISFLSKQPAGNALITNSFELILDGTPSNVMNYIQQLEFLDVYMIFESVSILHIKDDRVTAKINGYMLQLVEGL